MAPFQKLFRQQHVQSVAVGVCTLGLSAAGTGLVVLPLLGLTQPVLAAQPAFNALLAPIGFSLWGGTLASRHMCTQQGQMWNWLTGHTLIGMSVAGLSPHLVRPCQPMGLLTVGVMVSISMALAYVRALPYPNHLVRITALVALAMVTGFVSAMAAGMMVPIGMAQCIVLTAAALTGYAVMYGLKSMYYTRAHTDGALRAMMVPCDSSLRLNLPNIADPTVFLDETIHADVVNELRAMCYLRGANVDLGQRSLLFEGPSGVGKTIAVQGLANALGATLLAPRTHKLLISEQPGRAITEVFSAALQHTQATHRPVVLFFDECEMLFGKRGHNADAPSDNNKREARVTAFNAHLQPIRGVASGVNLVVVAATNHAHLIDASIRDRCTAGVLLPPNASQLHAMLPGICRQEQNATVLRSFQPCVPSASVMREVAETLARRGLAGRHLRNLLQSAFRMVGNTYYFEQAFAAHDDGIFQTYLDAAVCAQLKRNEMGVA
jgi:hypothetical protein